MKIEIEIESANFVRSSYLAHILDRLAIKFSSPVLITEQIEGELKNAFGSHEQCSYKITP